MAEIIASTYELIEKIGSGGGGTVYLAKHLRLNKKVVLKADKRKVTARPELLRREVDVLKDLSHMYIPKVYDFFAEGETVYTAMDFIEGESLDKPLKRGERFPQAQVITWAKQLLEALDYLHTPTHGDPPRGFVHSDIKPANLMRTPVGNICLIDFNIALALGEENIVGCSAGYASPEHYGLDYSSGFGNTGITNSSRRKEAADNDKTVLLNDESTVLLGEEKADRINTASKSSSPKRVVVPDIRSDIYSTGATLYHLLSGKRPAGSALEVVPLNEKEVSPQIARIISKAMAPNPEERYQSAAEMLYDLEHLRENDPRYKRLRRTAAITGAVLGSVFVLGVFSAFVGLKRIQSTESSLKLSEYSRSALSEGDAEAAVGYALQAIPEKPGLFTPDVTAEARSALTDALGVYDLSDGYKAVRTVELPSAPLFISLSPDGGSFACVYSGEAAVADISSGEITARLPADDSALSEVRYLNENVIIYAGKDGVSAFDISAGRTLWIGEKATALCISGDKRYAAAVYKNEDHANIYDAATGGIVCRVDFGGKRQSVTYNDIFVNHNDSLLAINENGSMLAASFSDGSLVLFDLKNSASDVIIDGSYGFTHFEGGFFGQYLAFSGSNADSSAFVMYDCAGRAQTGGFISDDRYSVITDEDGAYIQTDNLFVKIDPVTGDQINLVTNSDMITKYAKSKNNALIAVKNKFMFYDRAADLMSVFNCEHSADLLCMTDDTAVVGSMDSPFVRVLCSESRKDSDILSYDHTYPHEEARLSADEKTVMLFSYEGFRVYGRDGGLINETVLPDKDTMYDQQFIREGGSSVLEVTYYDGRKNTYSAADGSLISEEKAEKPSMDLGEEFFTDALRIEAPLHGTPRAYDKNSGKFIRELEKDAYLTYVTQLRDLIVAQYITTDGDYYGILMNEKCETLARLPYLRDVVNDKLIFDYPVGVLRGSRVYDLSELVQAAHIKRR